MTHSFLNMFHGMNKKALLSTLSRRAAITFTSIQPQQQRLYAGYGIRTRLVAQQLVDKNTMTPPKASTPKPRTETSMLQTKQNKTQVVQPPPKKRAFSKNLSQLPTTGWVTIRNIPLLSTLDDVLKSINEVMDTHLQDSIVDLDAVWKDNGQMTLFSRRESEEWVKSAHLVLSNHGRPNAWRIEFCNRSVAHAFLEHAHEHVFSCAWKPCEVRRWGPRSGETIPKALEIDDSVVRVENVGDKTTVDSLRHLFGRYDMTSNGPSVQVFNKESRHRMFLVHFADASWARAAIRELQGMQWEGHYIQLAQYPRQLISTEDE
jgi:hypothetical protein